MILAQGYNHFRSDTPEHVKNTTEKYLWITHAEEHAQQQTNEKGIDTTGYLMVMPWWPCKEKCAPAIIRGGLSLLCHKQLLERSTERWQENLDHVIDLFDKEGVRYVAYDGRVAGVEHLFNKEIWYP